MILDAGTWKEFFENPDISWEQKGEQAEKIFPHIYKQYIANSISYIVRATECIDADDDRHYSYTQYSGIVKEEAFSQKPKEEHASLTLEVWINGELVQDWSKPYPEKEFQLTRDRIQSLRTSLASQNEQLSNLQKSIEENQALLDRIDILGA